MSVHRTLVSDAMTCAGPNPFQTYQNQAENAVSQMESAVAELDAEYCEYDDIPRVLESCCENALTTISSELSQASMDVTRLVWLTECERIQPTWKNLANEGICGTTMSGLYSCWWCITASCALIAGYTVMESFCPATRLEMAMLLNYRRAATPQRRTNQRTEDLLLNDELRASV